MRTEQISNGSSVSLNQSGKLFFKADSSLFNMNLYFNANSSLIKIDSVEYSPYKSFIYMFKNDESESFVLIWETQYEQYSYSNAYFLKENQLHKIGELEVVDNCNSCEHFEFPIRKLEIKLQANNVEFSFLDDIRYRMGKPDEKIIKAKHLKYVYESESKILKCFIE